MIEKARQDLVTNRQIIRQIRVDDRGKMPVTGKYIPRGERDVIRLRNPTEDKRAFRRMLTSADLLVFRYGGHIGKRQDPGDEISKGQGCFPLLSNLLLFPNSYKNSHFQNGGKCKIAPE